MTYSRISIARTPMARSPWLIRTHSVLCPYEILPIDQEKKYLSKLSYIIMKLYVVYTY